MAFQLSPGVNVSETDLTTVVPAVATSDGAIGGVFRWGPVEERVLIDSENLLVKYFGKPTNLNAETFFTAANFLNYGNRLYVSRAAKTDGATPSVTATTTAGNSTSGNNVFTCNTSELSVGMYVYQTSNTNVLSAETLPSITSINSSAIILSSVASINTSGNSVTVCFALPDTTLSSVAVDTANTNAVVANLVNQIVKNENHYETKDGNFDSDVLYVARHPGVIGNSLKVSVCDNSESFSSNVSLTNVVSYSVGSATATFEHVQAGAEVNSSIYTSALADLTLRDFILVGNSEIGTQYMSLTAKSNVSINTTSQAISITGILGNSTGVNASSEFISSNNIFADGRQKFIDTDEIQYIAVDASNVIGGLANSTTYFVISSNTTGFKLATSSGGSAINLTANSGSTHSFVASSNLTNIVTITNLSNTGIVNTTANFIIANNGTSETLTLNDGDFIVYANAASNAAIGGLSSGSTFIITGANSSGFKLASGTTANVITLDVTSLTTNTSHTFTANTSRISFTLTFEDPYRLHTNYSSNNFARYWEYFKLFETDPGQSTHQLNYGNTSAQDELHIVVADESGLFSGTPGAILETYKGLSRATDAKNIDGSTNYYKDIINDASRYVWWANDRSGAPSANSTNLISSTASAPASMIMRFGNDGQSESNASLSILGAAYDMFASTEDVDISLVLQGKPTGGSTVVDGETITNYQLANYLIDNICEIRKDCIVLISPDKSKVYNNIGREAVSLKNWRNAIHSSSYAVLDSGYKYQYDRYNDIYRWIPLNGDIAGLCVRTDTVNDSWFSPAGFNRGQIKNIVKIAYNPRKSERDILFSHGINPVVTFPGQGTVLFGDKTLQSKPSAFDRINVRRLFIVLEKAISRSAKFSLFEFNDAFTRSQFKNIVTPYLRTIQGRRGITDFLVVCDETNNTSQIIDSNQFVGDIFIKPAKSINFIQLNFVAVGTGVQFSEVVGRF